MGQIKQMNYSCERIGTVSKEFKANQEKVKISNIFLSLKCTGKSSASVEDVVFPVLNFLILCIFVYLTICFSEC